MTSLFSVNNMAFNKDAHNKIAMPSKRIQFPTRTKEQIEENRQKALARKKKK